MFVQGLLGAQTFWADKCETEKTSRWRSARNTVQIFSVSSSPIFSLLSSLSSFSLLFSQKTEQRSRAAMAMAKQAAPLNPKTFEKIHVAIRVRPLSAREISLKDSSAWDCVDDRTIAQRALPSPPSSTPERSPHQHQHHHHQKKSYSFGTFRSLPSLAKCCLVYTRNLYGCGVYPN
jgi:hypothetical protein